MFVPNQAMRSLIHESMNQEKNYFDHQFQITQSINQDTPLRPGLAWDWAIACLGNVRVVLPSAPRCEIMKNRFVTMSDQLIN